jgi:hypothetical protein
MPRTRRLMTPGRHLDPHTHRVGRGYRSMSRRFHAKSRGTLRRSACLLIGLLLTFSGLAALFSPSSAQAAQVTSFSVLVNGSTSATIATTGIATLSVSGIPSTTVGAVTFEVNGDSNCEIGLTGLPNESTSCKAEPYPGPGPGSYPVTATFYGPDDNGDTYFVTSSNSATLTISGQTNFTIAVNGSSSAMIPPGGTADLTLAGLPWSVAGPVTFSANGIVICTDVLSPDNQPGCYSSPSLQAGTYPITATFTDTDGVYWGSTSSNSVTLTVSTQTNFTISVLNSGSVPSSTLTTTSNDLVSLSETGLPSTAIGVVTFNANGTVLCTVSLTAGFEEATSCAPSLQAGTNYAITATFTDTNGALLNSTSSNSVEVNILPWANFTISVDNSSSATVAAGGSATLAEAGLPPTATGTLYFYANQTVLCSVNLNGQPGELTTCTTSLAGSYSVTGNFDDTDGSLGDAPSTNSVTLTIYPEQSPSSPSQGGGGGGSSPEPTSFTISVNGTQSPTITNNATATFGESGLPFAAVGEVTFEADGESVCHVGLNGTIGEQTGCSSGWAFGMGSFTVTASFTDTDGSFSSSTSSNTMVLSVTPQASLPIPTAPTTSPSPVSPPIPTSPSTPPPPVGQGAKEGYDLVGSDGGIFTFGSALFYGSTGSLKLQRPVVGITPTPDHGGYWLVASDGGMFAFGDAGFYGSIPGLGLAPAGSSDPKRLNAPIVGVVPSADGGGYFMVAADGGVFAFGDATFEGSCPSIGGCSGTAVAVMPDASGDGYWLVTSSGGVYAFGDAASYGAPGPQSVPVTSAVRTTDGAGYWILFANGVVDAYGDAKDFGGPTSSVGGSDPATTIFTTSDGGGYWVASADGSVFTYGDAAYEGGESGKHLNGPIIAGTGW